MSGLLRVLLTSVLLLLTSCFAHAQGDDGLPPPPAPVVHPLTVANGSPYIRLTIAGATGQFLLDTGANTSGIDRTWFANHGVPTWLGPNASIGGTTGTISVPTVAFNRVDLAHGYFLTPTFLSQDFSGFAWPGGEPQAGLLGTDFLSAYAVTLDLAHGSAAFALRGERAPLGPNDATVRLDYPLNLPTASVTLGGVQIPCRLDTGAAYLDDSPYLDVNWATVNALQAAGVKLDPRGSLFVSGVSGGENLPVFVAADASTPLTLGVGPAKVPGVILVVHGTGTLATGQPLALAGARLIARLGTVTLDPFDHTLILRDAPRAFTPSPTPLSGAALGAERDVNRLPESRGMIDALVKDRAGSPEDRGER